MIHFEVLKHQEQNRRDGFDDYLLVSIRIDSEFNCEKMRACQVFWK
jgi:hypothetical protein